MGSRWRPGLRVRGMCMSLLDGSRRAGGLWRGGCRILVSCNPQPQENNCAPSGSLTACRELTGSSMRQLLVVCSVMLSASICGCAHYRTPGGGVSIPAITDAGIADVLSRKPAAQFPAHLVVARVQASGYQSQSGSGYGRGRYSVLTTRDIETDEDFM